MFELIGDKKELYQWDRDRRITIPKGVTKVRFSNLTHGVSTDRTVIGEEMEIPPELLRIHGDLFVWGGDENNTDYSKHFNVIKSPKPADYIYAPEELKKWEDLQKQIGKLDNLKTKNKENLVNAINEILQSGGGVDAEEIEKIVDEYLEANPPTVKETDPTVPDWAKKPTKPTYTPEEIGALSQDELQNSVNLALQQAKESGEFDGKDGYTPIKGVDYFDGDDYVLTESDKKEIVDDAVQKVLDTLPVWEGGRY